MTKVRTRKKKKRREEEGEEVEAAKRAVREGTFVDSEEERGYMGCFDSDGAPKKDRRSREILAMHKSTEFWRS
jgi:hypothetical protein